MTLHTASLAKTGLAKTALRSGFAAFALTAVALGGMQLSMGAQAQAIAGHNSRAPLSVDAGNITARRIITMAGDVRLQRGGDRKTDRAMKLTAARARGRKSHNRSQFLR